MFNKKNLFIYIIAIILLFGSIYFLYSIKIWPFSTGTNVPAFLGSTFEMSLPETQRILKKSGAQLVDRAVFNELDSEIGRMKPFVSDLFDELLFSEDKIAKKNEQLWYMPSIYMFDSQVVAEFDFYDNKLTSVQVVIYPISKKKIPETINKLLIIFKSKYKLFNKEFSKDIPEAYSITFKDNSSKIEMWVNLANLNDPAIRLFISYNKDLMENEKNHDKRESTAFS